MKITELIKKLDEKYPENRFHNLRIFATYGGGIYTGGADIVVQWGASDMDQKLNDLWVKLNESTGWEL